MHSIVIISKDSLNSQLISHSSRLARQIFVTYGLAFFLTITVFDTSGAGGKVVVLEFLCLDTNQQILFVSFIVPFSISETLYHINSAVKETAFKQ